MVLGISQERGDEIIKKVAQKFQRQEDNNQMIAIESLVKDCQNTQEVAFTFFCSGVNKGMIGRNPIISLLGMLGG